MKYDIINNVGVVKGRDLIAASKREEVSRSLCRNVIAINGAKIRRNVGIINAEAWRGICN